MLDNPKALQERVATLQRHNEIRRDMIAKHQLEVAELGFAVMEAEYAIKGYQAVIDQMLQKELAQVEAPEVGATFQ